MKFNKLILFFLISCSSFISSYASWRVFVYMDSSDELSDMAIKNITDMLAAQPNDNVEIRIQLHAYDNLAHRYHVLNNNLTYIQSVELSGVSKQDFITAAEWGFDDNQSDYTMAILWNHGWGILDPHWDEKSQDWLVDEAVKEDACPVKGLFYDIEQHMHKNHKGFMFSKQPCTYLNNQDLVEALATINKTILNDKKLDVLAFDTCMGAMLEVAYQAADYTRYFVGNQSCSLRDGFNYQGVVSALNAQPKPREAAKNMVEAFNEYYNQYDASGIYTHSAVDALKIVNVCTALDEFLSKLFEVPNCDSFIINAAKKSTRFCLFPMYTDLIAFLKNIEDQLDECDEVDFQNLKKLLHEVELAMSECIVARCGGSTTLNKAYGLSIYLPKCTIDSSYFKTLFANKFKWLDVVRIIEKG